LYIEMEYADAGTLAEFLSQLSAPLQEYEILLIFRQIVCAISYLHENNILHRDIKTDNIFLNKEGYIKVGDFGISKMLTTKREAESVVGTPYYISPEIVILIYI
jgi:serine/threonine protein kinase